MAQDYYRLLGVSQTADSAEIRKQYRAMSKKYHPDVGGSMQAMQQINEAYRTLNDPALRAIHDSQLASNFKTPAYSARPQPVPTPTPPTAFRQGPPRMARATQPATPFWPRVGALVAVGLVLIFFAAIHPTSTPVSADTGTQTPTQQTTQTTTTAAPTTSTPTDTSQEQPASNATQPQTTPDTAAQTSQQPVDCTQTQNQQSADCITPSHNTIGCSNDVQGAITYSRCTAPNGKTYCLAHGTYTYKYYHCD